MLPTRAVPGDVVDVGLMQSNFDPVPGVMDEDFDLRFIGAGPLVHVPVVHAGVDMSGFWTPGLPPAGLSVRSLPVCMVALIRGDPAGSLVDRTPPQVRRELVKQAVEIRVLWRWVILRSMAELFHIPLA